MCAYGETDTAWVSTGPYVCLMEFIAQAALLVLEDALKVRSFIEKWIFLLVF